LRRAYARPARLRAGRQARKFLETMYLPEGGATMAGELIKRGASKKIVKQMSATNKL